MQIRLRLYVISVVLAAGAAGILLYAHAPGVSPVELRAILVLAILGLVADLLAHSMSTGGVGSISFVPHLALIALVPTWATVLTVALGTAVASFLRGGRGIKPVFNFGHGGVSATASILAYSACGGSSLLLTNGARMGFSWSILLALTASSVAYIATNLILFSGVLAFSESRSPLPFLKNSMIRTMGYDILASPVVYLLVWLYVSLGVLGAVFFSAPLLVLREVYKMNRQLEKVNQELLELMVKAIEARDPYTSGHSRRVSQYSKIIARAVGCGFFEIERIGIAALLHDVGKIHEMYAPILQKPEKLSPAEWAVMQTHPIKSAELVATVSHLKDIVAPVRHHHENWDGTGYPDGLVGENIPLGARIVLFADTIDAMTTDRPYRKALSEIQVRSELIKYRGKQFDPSICDKLLSSPMFGLLFAPNSRQATPEGTSPALPVRSERAAAHS